MANIKSHQMSAKSKSPKGKKADKGAEHVEEYLKDNDTGSSFLVEASGRDGHGQHLIAAAAAHHRSKAADSIAEFDKKFNGGSKDN